MAIKAKHVKAGESFEVQANRDQLVIVIDVDTETLLATADTKELSANAMKNMSPDDLRVNEGHAAYATLLDNAFKGNTIKFDGVRHGDKISLSIFMSSRNPAIRAQGIKNHKKEVSEITFD